VTTRSSIASPRVGVLITWLKKLSSMHSRNLLDCLQLAVLLFNNCWNCWTFSTAVQFPVKYLFSTAILFPLIFF